MTIEQSNTDVQDSAKSVESTSSLGDVASTAFAEAEAQQSEFDKDSDSQDDLNNTDDSQQSDANGESSEQGSEDQSSDDDATGSDDESDSDNSSDDDSVGDELAAPTHWPDDVQSAYNELPQEAKSGFMSLSNQLQTAVQAEWVEINQVAKQHADSIELAERFESDQKGVIDELARRAGIDIFYEQSADEAMPEFDNPEDMATWIENRAEKKAQAREDARVKSDRAEQGKRDKQAKLESDFRQANEQYPDFIEHKDAILNVFGMYSDISPIDAYRLVRFNDVAKQASDAVQLKSQLVEAQEQIRQHKAGATTPAANGSSEDVSDDDESIANLRPAEQAFRKAQQSMKSN